MNKPGIEKTTIKSLFALAVFSVVLEINSRTIYNYLIFVGVWILLTAIYEAYKYSTRFALSDNGLEIRTPLKYRVIPYSKINDAFLVSGFLQKRFKLSSVYVVMQKNAVGLRDLMGGEGILNDIEDRIGRKRTEFNKEEDSR
jgi:membrane protein YdbS with pleckstrin-like domain